MKNAVRKMEALDRYKTLEIYFLWYLNQYNFSLYLLSRPLSSYTIFLGYNALDFILKYII